MADTGKTKAAAPAEVPIGDALAAEIARREAAAIAAGFALDRMPSRRQAEKALQNINSSVATELAVLRRNIPDVGVHDLVRDVMALYTDSLNRLLYPLKKGGGD